MDEKRLQKVRENLNRHNERKKNQNIMSEVDSSKFDKTSSTYNKYDEGFERAKYHYQNSYLPKKAQKYYETVSEYKSPYQAVNKPSEDNTTVLTPDNLIANNLADGGYIDENTRNYVQNRTDEAFNNQYKKYAEQYSRINSRGKEAYNAAQNAQKTANEINSNVDKFYSQFKDGSDYANYLKNKALAEENARLLSYDIPAARQKLEQLKANEPDKYGMSYDSRGNSDNIRGEYKEWENSVKSLEDEIQKAETVQQFAKDMQDPVKKAEYERLQKEANDFQIQYSNQDGVTKAVSQAGNVALNLLYGFNDAVYGVAESVKNGIGAGVSLLDPYNITGLNPYYDGSLGNTIDNGIQGFFDASHEAKATQDRFSSYYNQGLRTDLLNLTGNEDASNFLADTISNTANALAEVLPNLALAYATGGTSLATTSVNALNGLSKTQKAAMFAKSTLKGLAKNPSFWYSFIREGGSAYNEAKAQGASELEANIAMFGTGLPNALIEIGGGVESLPNDKSANGIRQWIKSFVKTGAEEGLEEIEQGIVSQLMAKAVYAPEMSWFTVGEDGIIDPVRMIQEFYGGFVGGSFGGLIGKGINTASYVIANNMYKSDTMRSIIQSGQYADLVASMPESDFTKSDISKMFTSDMTEEQILKSLKKVSNKSLRKQYDSMVSALSKISTDNVAGIIFTATGDLDLASQTAPIIRKLYDGQAITDDEAKTILKDERIAYLISETSGYDLTNASYEDVVTLAERGSFENLSGTSTGNSFGDLLLGNSQKAEEGRNYIASIQDKYANDLIGKPTFTANVGENESVTIDGIDHIEDGEVYVKLSNGVIQEAQSLDTDEVTTALLSYASEYDTETASAFIGGYSGNLSVGEYARSFAMTRSAALTGLSAQQIASVAPMALSNIGQTAFDAAVKSVQEKAKSFASADEKATQKAQANQAKRLDKVSVKDKTGNTSTKEQKRLARFISKATGYTVTLVDSRNGYVNKVNGTKAIGEFNSRKGEIVLDIGSDNVMATALHEVTHYIKLNAPDEYKALCNFIIEYATRTGKIEEYLNAYTNGYKIDNVYELTEEMTADAAEALIQSDKFVEDIFNDPDFINAIAEEKQGIVRKFIDTLKSIVEAIKNYLKNGDVNHRIAAQLAQDVEALEQYEKLWVDALKAAVKNNAEMQSNAKENTDTESSGGKYSLNKNFSDKYDAWDKKRTGFAFYIGNTSDTLIRMGISNKKIYWDASKILKIKEKHPAMTDLIIKQVPNIIENPIIIMESKTIKGRLTLFGQVYDENNSPVLAVLELNSTKNGNEISVIKIASAYGKNSNPQKLLNESKILYVESNKKVADAWLSLNRLQLPLGVKYGYNTTISQNDTDVNSSIREKGGNNTKFSLPETDSNGNKLSEQQREYFKDSKVVDENGNLLVMYHGTDSYNEFSVFKKGKEGYLGGGIYLTSDKHYAERYANKNGYEGRIYETYVRIVNPLVVTSANPAVEILGEKTAKKRESKNSFSTKWITSADIRKLKEKGYDGIIWDFGGSIEVSVWESNQIKNIDNVEPTNNEDIRFSLAEPVEEKGNLIAVHNIYTDKLVKSLKLGGFPMPSTAIIKADMGHGKYGEISFVFDKSTIDPKSNKANKVYGGDAWTPTYPDIEYKVNDKAEKRLHNKYNDMYEKYGDKVRALYSYANTLEDKLNREGGEQKLIQNLYTDTGMMQVFRLDTGLPYIEDIYDKTEEKMPNEQIALSKHIIETLGDDAINEFADKSGDFIRKREELFKKYEDKIYKAFKNFYISEGLSESEAESSIKNKKHFEFLSAIFKAIKYKRNGGITIIEKFNSEATEKAILDNTDQDAYKKWLVDNFSGIVEKQGIYNGKNIYTASGNRRSFDALHYEETLENVVKVMSEGLNGDTLFGGMGIWGVSNKEYSSIDEIKADSSRLKKVSDDEYHEIRSGYAEQFAEIANAISIGDSENDVIKADIAATNIVDAVRNSKTKSGIKSYLKKYYPDITDANVDDIVSLVHGIMNMPTGYFEAKPMRVVRFDEVRYVVLPDTLDEDIKKQLSDYGMQIREYEEGNEEDRTEKLNSLDDVKFSLSDRTSAEYDLLTQENEELKAQVEALKNEMKLTKGHKVNPEAVKKLAKKYLKDYSSTADIDEVSAKLKEIFDYVASDNAYAGEAQRAMYELAYNIINNSETLNTEMRDEFKDVLDVIKSTPIYVDSTTKAEIESLYGDYNTFRKSMFGRMRLTTNKKGKGLYSNETVDSLNQTLSEMLPGTFPANVSEGDALANIVDFIEMTKPTMQNEFEGNVKEAAYQLAAEMFDDYFDTPEIKTFADKQQAKLNKVINQNRKARAELKQKISTEQKEIYEKKLAEIKEKQKAKLAEVRADRDEKLDALRKEKNERISEIRKEKNDKREADVKALREQKNAELAEVRADREAKLQALREVYKERNEKKREKANAAKLKARIAKLVKSLSNDLLTNSQKHHIPEELKKITGELLANINLMSAKQEADLNSDTPTKVAIKMQNDLNKLRLFIKDYGALESDKDGNNNYTINFDPDLDANIKKFEEYLQMVVDKGIINIRDMNIEELTAVHNMLAALRKAVNDVNKAYSNRLTQAITEIAEGSIAEISAKRDRPNLDDGIKKVVGLLDNYANFQMLDSRSFFYNMGDSSFKIHQALRDGLDIRTQKLQEAQAFFKDALSSFTKKEIKEIIEEAYDFDVTGGKLHMTKAQIMSLYELNKREQGKEHIYKGGIRPTNTKNKRNPKPIMVNQEDVLRIVSTLSDEEIKLADSIQKFLANNCAAWGNEVTMDMYGYKKFVEEFYFPITSFDAQVNTNDNNASNGADKASMFTILNYGMTKALTPNANNAIDISNIFDVATKHIVEMSNYAGYAKPLSDAMRWFNYRNRSTGESVKGSMYAKYENKGKQYFVELIKDINNQKATGDYGGELTSMLVSGAKTASIAANLSVVVQQPTAYVRASAVLNPDILMKGAVVAAKHIKKSTAEVKQYCPIAYWKSQGYFDTSLGKSINETITGIKSKKDAVVEASMSLAGLMDDVTWAAIWESTKIWVQENHPDVAVDSQAFFDIASEKFRDVVDQTQVVDTVLHRPMILRSKNALVKMSFAFMSEPLKSANLVRNAALDMRYKKPGAKHKFVRALASSVLANLAAAATKAIIMALRDTGDDDWLTKWLNSFLDDAKNSLNPFNIFPVIKDIFSMLNGFDVERMDMTAVAGIVDFSVKIFEYAQKDKLDEVLNLNTIYKLTRYLSQLTGVPVYNVLRDVDAVIDIFGDPIFRKPNTSTSNRVQKLYDAAMANDTEAFNSAYNMLKSEGKTQKEIESSLKSKIVDDSRGNAMFNELVDKAAKERINGNISESVRIVKELASTTALSSDFWKACVNARINKLNGRSENREELISSGISREIVDTMSDDEVKEALKSYQTESTRYTSDSLTEDTGTVSLYTSADLAEAIASGKYDEYNEMYQDILEVKVTNLLMKAEEENKELSVDEAEEKARKSIKSSMTDDLKKLAKSLYNSDKAKYKEFKKWLMKNLDYSSKTIDGWLTAKE